MPRRITADWVYVRLHGPEAAYQGSYPVQALSGWAGAFSSWNAEGKTVFCYFNNDMKGYAVDNAQRLREMFAG